MVVGREEMGKERVLPSAGEVEKAIAKAREGKKKGRDTASRLHGKTEVRSVRKPKMSSSRRKKIEKKELKRNAEEERAGIIKELEEYKLTTKEKLTILPMSARR